MKKIILTAVLGCLATLFAVNANAQVHIVNGTESGNYTLSAAFQYIWSHSADELTVTLTNSIDLDSVSLERPADYDGFKGIFDGRNYTIQNFYINASLFGNLYGTVKNLNVKNVHLTYRVPNLSEVFAISATERLIMFTQKRSPLQTQAEHVAALPVSCMER